MHEKIAVIVGGTGKIGRGITVSLQNSGYHTVCVASHPASYPVPGVEYYVYDMSSQKGVECFYGAFIQKHNKIDVLVNAIGKNSGHGLYEIDEGVWNDIISTNLKSVFFICRSFYPLLSINKGIIINISSTAGIKPYPKSPHYIASKAGVIALTKYYAQVFAPDVRVNCIAPGYVSTENHQPETYDKYDDIINNIPMHKMASIEEISETILYFIKSESITGHTLVIDGGLTLTL